MTMHNSIPTSPEVWAVIKARHGPNLKVYASFSDPEGTFMGRDGTEGRMETSYALPGADFPLMEARTTWRIDPDSRKRHDEKHEYWLCVPTKDAD